jgi:hypothetical protein
MEFTTKETGKKVVIAPASFDDAFMLKSKINKALLENKIDPEIAFASGDTYSLILAIDGSMEVLNACFECLKKSTYAEVRITKELFDIEENRQDLYEILFFCLKVNVYPFYKSLISLLKTQLAKKS